VSGTRPAEAFPPSGACAPVLAQLGFACNNRCVFCAQGSLRARTSRSEPTAVRAALRLAGADDRRVVAFVGGEPTLDPNLADYIWEARRLGCARVLLQTNGRRLAYSAYLRTLRDAGLSAVEISLTGPRADVHDYHTRVADSFRQTLAGLRESRRAGLPVGLTFVVTRSNYRHLAETVTIAARIGVQAVHFAGARPRGAALTERSRVVPRIEAMADPFARVLEASDAVGIPVLVSGVPLCLVPGLSQRTLEGLQHRPQSPDARFADNCRACALRERCPGVEPGYAERYGLGELRPRTAGDRSHDDAARVAWLFAGLGQTEPQPPW